MSDTGIAIKPTHKAVKDYYATLKGLHAAGGKRETELRGPFSDLLSKLARQQGWTFMEERPITIKGHRIAPDGTLLDEHHVPRGHWEAKDTTTTSTPKSPRRRPRVTRSTTSFSPTAPARC